MKKYTFCFPKVIGEVITDYIDKCDTFEKLLERVRTAIAENCDKIRNRHLDKPRPQHPFMSVYFDGCKDKLKDVFCGGVRYNNYGCHGIGIANAADALAAVKKVIYQDKSMSKEILLKALKADFNGYSAERNMLKACPKMGNNDDFADSLAGFIMKAFSESMNGKPNGIGGIWRAGTGSAQCYMQDTDCTTADGRKYGIDVIHNSAVIKSVIDLFCDKETTGIFAKLCGNENIPPERIEAAAAEILDRQEKKFSFTGIHG